MNIYIGNLSDSTKEVDLRKAFEAYGDVKSVTIIKDRSTGNSRGFGFVEMHDEHEALAAVESLNGSEVDDRTITVNEARRRSDRRERLYRNNGFPNKVNWPR